MGRLEHGGGATVPLRARHLIGRSPSCDLTLPLPLVSGEHAILLWDGSGWSVKDLASRNGTTVQGRSLPSGTQTRVPEGARVGFGDDEWVLADAGPPRAFATDGSRVYLEHDGLLALPGTAPIQADPRRGWVLADPTAPRPLRDRDVLEVDGTRWVLSLPVRLLPTAETGAPQVHLDEAQLDFRVSQDEEHVQITLRRGPTAVDCGARAHNYLLLLLARARLQDDDAGLPDSEQGWLPSDELARMLGTRPATVYTHVFRARKHFASLGVHEADALIARRVDARQVRLGTARIRIHRDG